FSVERFTDVTAKHWAYKEIIALNDRNVITGNYDGSFKPDANITREQAAVMLVRQLGLRTDNRPNPNFKDVSESRPLYPYIAAAAEAGLITGRGDRQFAPNETLTRAEMASILTRAYKLSGKATVSFTDVPASHWAHSSVQTLVANGLTSGYEDGSFRPNRAITRAEFSTFLYRVKQ
ncbi:MAG TPA: S-layer homology domain-containing protein, partial [Bacilli bacterium]|nr:S-layer homology domain-containing protein [Bacilli bacterium]